MWKMLIACVGTALCTAALIAGFAGASPIPFFNPSQLQIPATGADLNNLVNQINNNAVIAGPGGNSGSIGLPSGAFSVAQAQNGYPSPSINGLQIVGASANFQPWIRGVGSDPSGSVDVGIYPQGVGQLVLANKAQWIEQPSVVACPGAAGAQIQVGGIAAGNDQLTNGGPANHITGFFIVKDWAGVAKYVPTC